MVRPPLSPAAERDDARARRSAQARAAVDAAKKVNAPGGFDAVVQATLRQEASTDLLKAQMRRYQAFGLAFFAAGAATLAFGVVFVASIGVHHFHSVKMLTQARGQGLIDTGSVLLKLGVVDLLMMGVAGTICAVWVSCFRQHRWYEQRAEDLLNQIYDAESNFNMIAVTVGLGMSERAEGLIQSHGTTAGRPWRGEAALPPDSAHVDEPPLKDHGLPFGLELPGLKTPSKIGG
jgi:hypothetical protein